MLSVCGGLIVGQSHCTSCETAHDNRMQIVGQLTGLEYEEFLKNAEVDFGLRLHSGSLIHECQ